MSNAQTRPTIVINPASPVFWGSCGAMLIAAALFLGGAALLYGGDAPMPLSIALLVLALIEATTGLLTLQGKRVAWAFSLSINGTCAVVMLFSAPRLRDALEVSIIVALLPCIVFGVLVLLQSLRPEEF